MRLAAASIDGIPARLARGQALHLRRPSRAGASSAGTPRIRATISGGGPRPSITTSFAICSGNAPAYCSEIAPPSEWAMIVTG